MKTVNRVVIPNQYSPLSRQKGVTLLEIVAYLAIAATVAAGARALYSTASSSQTAQQLSADVAALQDGVKQLWQGQGSFGANGTVLNNTLVTAKRVPTTVLVDTTANPNTLTHATNGTITVASTGANYTLTLTNVSVDLCTSMMRTATGWISVKAGTAAARTAFPISPINAAADCATGTTMVYTGL